MRPSGEKATLLMTLVWPGSGTGGLPGGFAILRADKGHLTIDAQGSNADLHAGPIPPPKAGASSPTTR